jgi:hypothetical protein
MGPGVRQWLVERRRIGPVMPRVFQIKVEEALLHMFLHGPPGRGYVFACPLHRMAR